MRKMNNLMLVLASVITLGWTACTDKVDYEPVGPVEGQGVYFPTSVQTTYILDSIAGNITLPVMRTDTVNAVEVKLTAICVDEAKEVFTIPDSISFVAGSANANLVISYNNITRGTSYDITLELAEGTPYGNTSVTLTIVGEDASWKSLGKATYCDDLISGLFGLSPVTYQVEIQESEATPGLYRLVNPYGAIYPYNEEGDYDATNDYYLVINATDSNEVFLPQDQNLGIDWGYGFMGIYGTLEPGILRQGKITFPAKGIVIYDNDGAYYANNNGAFLVAMPGVETSDYSINVEYTGRYTDITTNENYVVMNLTWGDDVEYAKVALVENTDIAVIAAGIIDGSVESELLTTAGEIELPISKDGVYTCVAVSYAKETAQQSASTTCKVYLESIGIQNFCGGFTMSGISPFGEADANMPVKFTQYNDTILFLEGIAPSPVYVAYNEKDKIISIPAQQLDSIEIDGTKYDLMLQTWIIEDGYLFNEENASTDFACDGSGSLYIDNFSTGIGYVLYSNVLEAEIEEVYGKKNSGFWDGYYNIGFLPTSMPSTKLVRTWGAPRVKQLLPMAIKQERTKLGTEINQYNMIPF